MTSEMSVAVNSFKPFGAQDFGVVAAERVGRAGDDQNRPAGPSSGGGVGVPVVNDHTKSEASALPARSCTPLTPPLTVAVYVVCASSPAVVAEGRRARAGVVADRRRDRGAALSRAVRTWPR